MNTVETRWDYILLFALWLQLKEEIITEFYKIPTHNFFLIDIEFNSKSFIYMYTYTLAHTFEDLFFVADF